MFYKFNFLKHYINYYSISLEETPETWANIIVQCLSSFQRKDTSKFVVNSGFDISQVVEYLVHVYDK